MMDKKMSKKLKKVISLVILLAGLPVYIIVSITLLNYLDRPPILLELTVYVILGILWALPFKFIFKGVGRE